METIVHARPKTSALEFVHEGKVALHNVSLIAYLAHPTSASDAVSEIPRFHRSQFKWTVCALIRHFVTASSVRVTMDVIKHPYSLNCRGLDGTALLLLSLVSLRVVDGELLERRIRHAQRSCFL